MAERAAGPPARKAIAALRSAPDRLELLLRRCPEKDGTRRGGEPIRRLVGGLGTKDRFHWLALARRDVGPDAAHDPLPDVPEHDGEAVLAACDLAELLTRFRHVRAQSVEFLEALPAEDWPRVGPLVAEWLEHDAAALESLNAMCAELNRSQES
jgi:hypothetical protein